jgi:hypothetical protein
MLICRYLSGSDGTRTRDLRRDRPGTPLRGRPGFAGVPRESRAFLALSCGDRRARSGVSGDLRRDLRGIAASLVLLLCERWTRAVDLWGFKTCVPAANPHFSRRELSFDTPQDLEFLRAIAAPEQQDEGEQPTGDEVHERHKHRQPPKTERDATRLPANRSPAPHDRLCAPTGATSSADSSANTKPRLDDRIRAPRGFERLCMPSNPTICSGVAFTNHVRGSRGRFDVVELPPFRRWGLLWVKDGSGSSV